MKTSNISYGMLLQQQDYNKDENMLLYSWYPQEYTALLSSEHSCVVLAFVLSRTGPALKAANDYRSAYSNLFAGMNAN